GKAEGEVKSWSLVVMVDPEGGWLGYLTNVR
ncbi:MAG: hypothetical protein JWQ69_4443, partial [Pseudomonas sp.]|nr:hypothetical protein [Pseudomonas sp.]